MMGQRLTRRGVVKGLGLAPLVGVALPGAADASTPVMVEFAEYCRLTYQSEAFAGHVMKANRSNQAALFGQQDALYAQRDLVEGRLMILPSQTAADFAAKIIVDTARASMFSEWRTGALWIEARALTGCGML